MSAVKGQYILSIVNGQKHVIIICILGKYFPNSDWLVWKHLKYQKIQGIGLNYRVKFL